MTANTFCQSECDFSVLMMQDDNHQNCQSTSRLLIKDISVGYPTLRSSRSLLCPSGVFKEFKGRFRDGGQGMTSPLMEERGYEEAEFSIMKSTQKTGLPSWKGRVSYCTVNGSEVGSWAEMDFD